MSIRKEEAQQQLDACMAQQLGLLISSLTEIENALCRQEQEGLEMGPEARILSDTLVRRLNGLLLEALLEPPPQATPEPEPVPDQLSLLREIARQLGIEILSYRLLNTTPEPSGTRLLS